MFKLFVVVSHLLEGSNSVDFGQIQPLGGTRVWSASTLRRTSDAVRQVVLIRNPTTQIYGRVSSGRSSCWWPWSPDGWRVRHRLSELILDVANVAITWCSLQYLLLQLLGLIFALDPVQFISFRRTQRSIIGPISGLFFVYASILYASNLVCKGHKCLLLLEARLHVVPTTYLVWIVRSRSGPNDTFVHVSLSTLCVFLILCSSRTATYVYHAKSKWPLPDMWVAINEDVMGWPFFLNVLRHHCAWNISFSRKLHEIVSNLRFVLSVPVWDAVKLLKSLLICRTGIGYSYMWSLLFER